MELFLNSIFEQTDTYLLIVVRLLGFFAIIPVYGGRSVPNMTKVGFCVIVAGIILSTQTVGPVVYEDSVIGYGLVIIKELVVGLLMGYCVYMVFATLYYAGQLIDFQIGFSMVSVFDPVSQIQVPVMGNLYYFLVAALLIITHADHTLFRALIYSYEVLPIGFADVLSSSLVDTFMKFFSDYFVIGFKISLPVFGAVLIMNTALGLMAKTAPQVNIFSVGIPLKIVAGLFIVASTTDMFIPVSDYLFTVVYENLFKVIQGMIP